MRVGLLFLSGYGGVPYRILIHLLLQQYLAQIVISFLLTPANDQVLLFQVSTRPLSVHEQAWPETMTLLEQSVAMPSL